MKITNSGLSVSTRGVLFRWGLLLVVYLSSASYVLDSYMSLYAFQGSHGRNGFEATLEFQSHRPFVFRVLTPLVINTVARLVPDSLVEKHSDWFTTESPALQRYLKEDENLTGELGVKWHIAYGYLFLTLLGALITMRKLSLKFFPEKPMLCDYAPPLALLLLPLTFHIGGYMYDFPELFFLTLCLLFICSKQTVLFYLAFIAASLNKESNVLVATYFLVYCFSSFSKRQIMGHGFLLLLLGSTIVVGGRVLFSDNPGVGFEPRFLHNLGFWLKGGATLESFSPIAPLMRLPSPGNVFSAALLLFGVFSYWEFKPQGVRKLVLMAFAVNLPLFLLFSYENEVRALGLMFPILYFSILYSVQFVYDGVPGRDQAR